MLDSRVLLVVRALLLVWIGLFSIGCYWLLRLKVQIRFLQAFKPFSVDLLWRCTRAIHAYSAYEKICDAHKWGQQSRAGHLGWLLLFESPGEMIRLCDWNITLGGSTYSIISWETSRYITRGLGKKHLVKKTYLLYPLLNLQCDYTVYGGEYTLWLQVDQNNIERCWWFHLHCTACLYVRLCFLP